MFFNTRALKIAALQLVDYFLQNLFFQCLALDKKKIREKDQPEWVRKAD